MLINRKSEERAGKFRGRYMSKDPKEEGADEGRSRQNKWGNYRETKEWLNFSLCCLYVPIICTVAESLDFLYGQTSGDIYKNIVFWIIKADFCLLSCATCWGYTKMTEVKSTCPLSYYPQLLSYSLFQCEFTQHSDSGSYWGGLWSPLKKKKKWKRCVCDLNRERLVVCQHREQLPPL